MGSVHIDEARHSDAVVPMALMLFLLQTTGVEVVVAQVPIPETTLIAELYLLDTSGSDLYKEALPQYWSGVYFAILVFDITNPESFDSCKQWNDELKKNRFVGILWTVAGRNGVRRNIIQIYRTPTPQTRQREADQGGAGGNQDRLAYSTARGVLTGCPGLGDSQWHGLLCDLRGAWGKTQIDHEGGIALGDSDLLGKFCRAAQLKQ